MMCCGLTDMSGKENTYADREIDEMVKDVKEQLDRIEQQTTATNGKVKKITIALIALAFFSLGLGLSNPQLLTIILAAI